MIKVKSAARVGLVSLIWIIAVGGIWASHEYNLTHGTEVTLKAVPVDPRDFFRGDYVILRYEMSTFNFDEKIPRKNFKTNQFVFIPLKLENEKWVTGAITDKKPAGLFFKGRIQQDYGQTVHVSYNGIESFFVPENKGHDYEQAQAANRLYAVMNVQSNGTANLKRLEIKD